jgi:uncharacterized membrane protein
MSRRTLFILLFASLALNLFVLGAVAGVYLFGPRMHRHAGESRGGGPAMIAAAADLPDDQRAAYRESLRTEAQKVAPQLREARQIRRDAWTRLGSDPVDPAAINADLDRARSLELAARAEVDRTILDFAARLPAADRARLGQALAQPPRRGLRHEPPPAR